MSNQKSIFIATAVICLTVILSTVIAFKKLSRKDKRIFDNVTNVLEQGKKDKLVSLLVKYDAYGERGPLTLRRLGSQNTNGYVVPEEALQQADAFLGYGIENDASFEEALSSAYQKPSYGFDCGVEYKSSNPLFTFIRECIATDKTIYKAHSSSKLVSSFKDQLSKLNLTNKKVFVKMDIEGAEYEAMTDIIKDPKNVTGLVFELHYNSFAELDKAVKLLSELRKDFVLVHIHGVNFARHKEFYSINAHGPITRFLELTYINKALLKHYHVAKDQKSPTALDQPSGANLPEVEFEILVPQTTN